MSVGPVVESSAASLPRRAAIEGRYVTLAPLVACAHSEALWECTRGEENDRLWAYLFQGPFRDRVSFGADLEAKESSHDPLFYSILDNPSGRAVGYASYLRI